MFVELHDYSNSQLVGEVQRHHDSQDAAKAQIRILKQQIKKQSQALNTLKTEWKKADTYRKAAEKEVRTLQGQKNTYKESVLEQQEHIVKLQTMLERAVVNNETLLLLYPYIYIYILIIYIHIL